MTNNTHCPTTLKGIKIKWMHRPLRFPQWGHNLTVLWMRTRNHKKCSTQICWLRPCWKLSVIWPLKRAPKHLRELNTKATSITLAGCAVKLARGANGTLETNISCHYCKDKGHTKENSVCLNNKLACDILLQEQAMAGKQSKGKGTGPCVPMK